MPEAEGLPRARDLASEVNTQAIIARKLGVSQPTVAGWLTPNIKTDKTRSDCDSRVKVPPEADPLILERGPGGTTSFALESASVWGRGALINAPWFLSAAVVFSAHKRPPSALCARGV